MTPFSGRQSRRFTALAAALSISLFFLAVCSYEMESTDKIGDGCTKEDINVNQATTPPLPNGIPTYTVEVLNLCKCAMADIHFACGLFSSAQLVDPRLFRRLRDNDCLLNDGRPLRPGGSISFQYANSFSYPMSVSSASSATCS